MTEVYYIKIEPDENFPEKVLEVLPQIPADRLNQIIKMKHKGNRARSLAGEILSRSILSAKTKTPFSEIRIKTSPSGKPVLEGHQDIHFNISHSGDYVACAISSTEVGIDIENKKKPLLKVASRFFTSEEYQSITKLTGKKQEDQFLSLWTIKESYLKCIGSGLTKALNSFTAVIKGKEAILYDSNGKKLEEFRAKKFDNIRGYKMAVCTKGSSDKFHFTALDLNNIIKSAKKK